MAAVEQVAKGTLSASKSWMMVMAEWDKARRFLKDKNELAKTSVDKLPGTKTEKVVFKSQVQGELNVDQRGQAALSARSALIKTQLKQAGNAMTKEEKYLQEAIVEASQATGQFLEAVASGKKSFEDAFKKKNGWFWGYTVVDRFIRASISLAEKSNSSKMALDGIKKMEEFKEISAVAAALAKNAEKITKLKSKADDPRTAPFEEGFEPSGKGEGASAGEGLPFSPQLKQAQQAGKQ